MDREQRRHLASYHQLRQLRLERTYSWRGREKYDPERKVQSDRGKKARFIAHLKGNVYEPTDVGLWYQNPPDPKRIGRLKKLSWDTCNWSCCHCANPRRNPWNKHRQAITMPERRSEESWQAQLLEMLLQETD
jgi:hypothetical protein